MARHDRLERYMTAPRPLVVPSLLACDFSRMDDELLALHRAGCAAVHLDVMDGHFVPNLTYGPPVIARWREATTLIFDAHLMISEPGRYLDAFLDAGCDQVTIHVEAVPEPLPLLRHIRASGARAGLALNPPTPLAAVRPFLDEVDSILVMSVMPGFGGQSFDTSALEKIRLLRELRPDLSIAVDGGIKTDTAPAVASAGATELIAGSAVFRGTSGGAAEALAELTEAARRGKDGA